MDASPKLLIIGLDGATFDVLGPLAERGHMPNLAMLMEKGCWGRLASTVPPFTAAAWSTFITGRNPGSHGVISFRKRDRYNYDVQGSGFVDARHFDETLWEILSVAEKRVGIVNVPLTFPARPVNGYMVAGMLTPPDADHFTFPRQFFRRLGTDYVVDVDFVRDEEGFRTKGFPSKGQMLHEIRNMSRTRALACARLLEDEPWDLFMVVFTSTDRVLHFFWDDLEAFLHQEQRSVANQPEIQAYFRELDEGIGRLTHLAGPSSTVFVMSDHGFGAAPTRRFYLNVWLEQLGLLRRRAAEGKFDLEYWRVVVGRHKRVKAVLRRLLPQSTQDTLTTVAASVSDDIIDWPATAAYFVPIYFHVCGVELNLSGGRREGIVEPGAAYESLRQRIIDAAQSLRDPRDGRPIVEKAVRREELYHGPHVDEFPDVVLVLNPDYIPGGSLAGSSLVESHLHAMRPGEHRQDGIFIAAGPAVLPLGELPNLDLLDVPPTALYAMDVPVASSFDGRVMEQIFDATYVRAHAIAVQDYSAAVSGFRANRALAGTGYSLDDEVAVEDRLRGLGYLE